MRIYSDRFQMKYYTFDSRVDNDACRRIPGLWNEFVDPRQGGANLARVDGRNRWLDS
jgi:hypothetical protein